MANGPWNGSVNDSVTGLAVGNARITVTDPATGDLVGLYDDRDGIRPKGNPFLTPPDGKVQFFARAGRVNIAARYAGKVHVFENEIILDDFGVGCACGNATAAVTATNYTTDSDVFTPIVGEGKALVFFGITLGELPDNLALNMAFGAGTFCPVFNQIYLPFNEFEGDATGRYFFVGVLPNGYAGYDGASELTLVTEDEAYPTLTMDNCFSLVVSGLREPTDVACLLDNVALDAREGFFDTGVMDAACDGSFIAYRTVSPGFGTTTPSNNTGFDHEEGDNPAGGQGYWGYGYAAGDTSKQVTISIGSGPIYGAMIILRTAATIPPEIDPPVPPVITYNGHDEDGEHFLIALDSGDRLNLTNFVAQLNIEGGGWEDDSTILADATEYTYPINTGLFEFVIFRIVSVNGAGSAASNEIILPP